MELYTDVSYELAGKLTKAYSTSFSLSITLFAPELRPHIYAIYGMVRLGDEIVDSYTGDDKAAQLNSLESEIELAITTGYSSNPIIHAYVQTARRYDIPVKYVKAFFESMRMDLGNRVYTKATYQSYIYGSAEVVGLMCLRVFVDGNKKVFKKLEKGAQALGSAYQKVNFLRDIRADYETLHRWYFPKGSFDTFNDEQKDAIIDEIASEFQAARTAIIQLPDSSRRAVALSVEYYSLLLEKIKTYSADELKQRRVRISNVRKLALLARVKIGIHEK